MQISVGDLVPCALSLRPPRGCFAVAPLSRGLLRPFCGSQGEPASFGRLSPDIVVTHEPSRIIFIIDVTVLFKTRSDKVTSSLSAESSAPSTHGTCITSTSTNYFVFHQNTRS
ncbi:unnamed protein product [Heterotrigona itama]|uniref:Uncharacterized protein n=1 Tax=Heterotrigona itama TaxID=395501 RepID=A0A6V7H9G7_9HYME|nr:unnamed protein product [Heterotrigona itama]